MPTAITLMPTVAMLTVLDHDSQHPAQPTLTQSDCLLGLRCHRAVRCRSLDALVARQSRARASLGLHSQRLQLIALGHRCLDRRPEDWRLPGHGVQGLLRVLGCLENHDRASAVPCNVSACFGVGMSARINPSDACLFG
jgi:hypothetical protein